MVEQKLSTRDFLRSIITAMGVTAAPLMLRGSKFSPGQTTRLAIGSSSIEVSFDPTQFDLPANQILSWVTGAARAVATYYGEFPVPEMRVQIMSSERQTGVFHGTTWGGKVPFTRIFVGRHTSQAQLNDDWMMTHEFVHTAFPDVAEDHHWIEEGIATYVEPIARVQAGGLRAGKIWADMVRGMPNGLPQPGDAGLNNTHTWGRTYWGGALFCLLADVHIRTGSSNRLGLQDALQGIQRAGGTVSADWTIDKAFSVGDQASHSQELSKLYSRMKDRAVATDLDSLWRDLGVTASAQGDASFNNEAPLAATRLAITAVPEP